MTRLRFFGVAAYELITSNGQCILLDPFLDENPGSPLKSDELDRVDLIIVSHAAIDHLGDTEALARRTGAPVICGGEVKAYLMAKGIAGDQIRATTWGIAVEVAGIKVQPVKCEHWSQIKMPDGTFASVVPMAFVVYADPGVRFYHYGDTALFTDMKLQAELFSRGSGAAGRGQDSISKSRVRVQPLGCARCFLKTGCRPWCDAQGGIRGAGPLNILH